MKNSGKRLNMWLLPLNITFRYLWSKMERHKEVKNTANDLWKYEELQQKFLTLLKIIAYTTNFAGSTITSLNQSLHFSLMWNHNILYLRRICALQVRGLWQNSPFAGPNMKACIYQPSIHYLKYMQNLFFSKALSMWNNN